MTAQQTCASLVTPIVALAPKPLTFVPHALRTRIYLRKQGSARDLAPPTIGLCQYLASVSPVHKIVRRVSINPIRA